MSGQRAAIFYAFLLIILTLAYLIYNSKKHFKYVLFLLIPLCTIYFFNINQSQVTIKHTYLQFYNYNTSGKIYFFSKTYENYKNISIYLFKKNKLIGIGPKAFKKHCIKQFTRDVCNTHPHNIFFQALAETGLVGTGVYILILGLTIFMLIKSFIIKNPNYLIFYSIFIFLNPLIPSGSLFNNWLLIIHFISIPFAFHKIK